MFEINVNWLGLQAREGDCDYAQMHWATVRMRRRDFMKSAALASASGVIGLGIFSQFSRRAVAAGSNRLGAWSSGLGQSMAEWPLIPLHAALLGDGRATDLRHQQQRAANRVLYLRRSAGAKRRTEHPANCSFMSRMFAPKSISSPRSAKSCNPKLARIGCASPHARKVRGGRACTAMTAPPYSDSVGRVSCGMRCWTSPLL